MTSLLFINNLSGKTIDCAPSLWMANIDRRRLSLPETECVLLRQTNSDVVLIHYTLCAIRFEAKRVHTYFGWLDGWSQKKKSFSLHL